MKIYVFILFLMTLSFNIVAQTNPEQKKEETEEKPKKTPQEYFDDGIVKFKNGNFIGSANDFDMAIKEKNDWGEAYLKRARSRRYAGNYESAIEDYTIALRINPNAKQAYAGRAQAYLKTRNYNLAIKDYDLAILHLPNAPYLNSLYFNRGLAYQKSLKPKEALQDYTQVLQNDPEHAKALTNRGIIKYQQKQIRQACQDWIKAKKIGNEKAKKNVNKACQCCI